MLGGGGRKGTGHKGGDPNGGGGGGGETQTSLLPPAAATVGDAVEDTTTKSGAPPPTVEMREKTRRAAAAAAAAAVAAEEEDDDKRQQQQQHQPHHKASGGPAVWFALKKSLHCRSGPSDVHDPATARARATPYSPDHVNSLLMENLHLKSLLSDKRKEVEKLSSQVSNAESQITRQSTVEMKFLHQIEKLKWDIEDVRIEANLRDEISKTIFRNCACEAECRLEVSIMENTVLAEIYSTILGGYISDAEKIMNTLVVRHNEEKGLLMSKISRKDKILVLELQKADKLKNDLDLQIRLKEEKKILAQELQVRLEQHSHEIHLLKRQTDEQNRLAAANEKEVNVLKERFNDANVRVHQYEIEVRELNRNLEIALIKCEEAERQKDILLESIQKERDQMASINAERELEISDMNTLQVCALDLSMAFVEFERKVTESIQLNSSRLLELRHRWEPMSQLVDILRSQMLWYRQNLETKSSNLQKAENEVDLLGDEVDALLGVLAKMYIALDHYSPVLQHYPRVMEILRLVRGKLEGAVRPV